MGEKIIYYPFEGGGLSFVRTESGSGTYDLIPLDEEVAIYPGARALHVPVVADTLLSRGALLRDADFNVGRSSR